MTKTNKTMTKWLLSFVFALVMISLILLPQVLKVESSATTADTSWYTANTSASEYTLYDAADFLGFMELCYSGTRDSFTNVTIKLGEDINLNPGWSAACTVTNNVVTFPSTPTNAFTNSNVPNNFYGTLDGQGHTLSGFYSNRGMGDGNEFGGMFNYMRGTIKNLAIVNSFMRADRGSNWGSQNQRFGGIAGAFTPGSKMENCYIDAEVWFKSDNHYTFGYLAAGFNGGTSNVTIKNVVMKGRFAVAGSNNAYNKSASSGCKCGYLCGEGNGKPVVLDQVLIDVTKAAPKMSGSAGTNNVNYLVHYSNGSVTGADTVKIGKQSSAPNGNWTYLAAIGSYAPATVTTMRQTYFRNQDWDTSGSTLHITSPQDLLQFEYLLDHDTTFAGKTVYLDCDIDVNPGWSAAVSFSGATGTGLSNSTGNITFPSYPATEWTNIGRAKSGATKANQAVDGFRGTFDGQGHTISGIYAIKETASTASSNGHTFCANNQTSFSPSGFGLLFNRIQSGAVVRNLSVTNSICIWNENMGSSEAGFGGLIGGMSNSGGDCTVSNIYSEVSVILRSNAHPSLAMGGIVSWQGGGTISNCVFNGVMATANGTGSTSYPAQNVKHHIGGIAGESEGGTLTDCLGIVTFAVKEPAQATIMGSDQSNKVQDDGTAHQVVAGHYGSDYGTATRCYEGKQASAPSSDWTYVAGTLNSYVPTYIAETYFADDIPEEIHIATDEAIANFNIDDGAGSSYLISSYADLLTLKDLSNTYDLTGKTFKLSADITANASLDATDTAKMFNEAPTNVWTPITNFKGTLDGNGHKITGLYSLITDSTGGQFTYGGMFKQTTGATIKNLIITNSFFGIINTTQSGSENRIFGGLIGDASDTTIQNVYLDAEVWFKTDVSRAFGGLVGKPSGSVTIKNFVYTGTFGSMKLCGAYSSWIGGSTPTGLITGHGNSKTITLTDVLLCPTVGVPASNMGSSQSTRVHWGNNNVSETRVYVGKQTSAIEGWTNNAALGSYIPTTVTVASPIGAYVARTRTDKAMSWLDSRDSGSYLIANAADLKLFNQFGQTNNCSGKTFKLTADIDLNSGWNATVTIDDEGVVHFPTQPSYVWTQIDNFYGVLDGQGHQISGLYRYATALGDSGTAGGMFLNLVGATVKNLVITNSFFGAQRTGWGSQNQKFGGLARSIQGATTIENLFFNAEVWFNTDVHRTAGMLAAEVVNDGASLTLNNVILAGRFGVCKYSTSKIETTSGSSAKGVIAGNANSKTITLNQVLVIADITLDAVKDGGTKTEKTVHYGPGGITGLDTLYYGFQKSPISGWVYQDALASYAPTDLTADYVILVEDAPISQFNEKLKPGSSFIITSMQDLLSFVTKINASSNKGAGYVFKLTADVDLNPGWSATPENTTKSDAPALKFPTAPATIWEMPTFKGTFDGQSHYIAGLYRTANFTSNWKVIGGFCDQLRENGTIKNTKFVNGLVILNSTNYNDNSVGGIVGQVGNNDDSSSAHLYLQNLYVDMGVYVGCPDWAGCEAGGLVGQAAKAFTIENCTFAGTVGLMYNDSTTFSGATFRCPPASNSSSAGNQIIADYGAKSGSVISNVVLAGEVIRNTNSSAQTTNGGVVYGLGRSGRTGTTPTVTNAFIGRCATVSAGTLTNENTPALTYSEDLGFIVTTQNYNMGLADMPDGSATQQSIQEFLNGVYNPGSIFTIATPADLIYAAELSQKGYTFNTYTLKLTANIDLNPGWNAKVTIDGDSKPTIPAMPPVLFPGFKEFRGTLDGDNHYISGIAMYKIFTKQDNLGFVEYLYGNILNVKFNNGLIYAQTKNYGQSDSKIGGIAARIQSSSATLENLYVDLNVWYRSGSAHRIGGIAAKVENGAHLTNIKFAGVVGTMKFEGEGGTVPSQSTGLSLSQLVADGNWKSALYITNCTMAGTVYAAEGATNPTNQEISSNINRTNVSGTGTATVTGSAYSNSTSPFSILPSAYGATADSKTANYESSTLTKTYYYQEITRAQFTNYINALKSAGYVEMQNYSIGDSSYYLLQNGTYMVYASRIPCSGYTAGEKHRARVYVEPYGRDQNTVKTATAKSTLCTAQLWQLNVDNWYSKSSGGACYVMRLTDGRFLIVDSGFGSTYEADNLYKILYENNVRDGEPVIAGWFFTHTHEDHVKGFQRFTAEGHGADVIVEAFYVNFPSHEVVALEGEGDDLPQSSVNATMVSMTAYPDAKIYKVHSGQSFGFADTTVRIIYTHEDAGQSYWSGTTLTKNQLYNGNDTSLIFQVQIGDEKILFTGDSYKGAENAIYYTFPASSYASKFVTVSHHGYEGLSKAFYQAVAPTVALWPMDVARFQQDGTPYSGTEDEFSFYYRYNHTHSGNRMWEANNYFKSTSSVKEVIPAYENACLTLPYTAKTYSGGSKTINLTTAYNNKVANPDGAGGLGVTINEWYDEEAEELHITSRKDLFDFMKAGQKGKTFVGKTVYLDVDISVNPSWSYTTFLSNGFMTSIPADLSVWKAIPTFKGTFDGQGHTIRNLYTEVTVSGSNNYYGGFIQSLKTGASVSNLIIKNSAMVATFNTTQGTSSNKIGGFIGRIYDEGDDDIAILTNLYVDMDVYYVSGGCASLAGLVGTAAQVTVSDVKHTAQFLIENIVYAGDLVCVALNGQAGGNITLVSGQHMYGPIGIMGLSTSPDSSEEGLTREITNTVYLGTLIPVGNSGETLYDGAFRTNYFGLNDVVGTNTYGSARTTAVEGFTNNTTLGSYIPDSVHEMLSAVAPEAMAQQTAEYTVNKNDTSYQAYDLRFIGTLKDVFDASALGNYSKVGMIIRTVRNGVELFNQEITTETVYESLYAGETQYTKDDAGGFLYAFVIKGVPVTADMEFYVTTFSVSSDTSRPMNERKVINEEVKFIYDGGLTEAED